MFYFVAHIFKCIIVAVINILLIYIYVFTVFNSTVYMILYYISITNLLTRSLHNVDLNTTWLNYWLEFTRMLQKSIL